jgi:hypothetical protein
MDSPGEKHKDAVIGFMANYNFSQIRPWLNSLKMTGFQGDIFMITQNVSQETLGHLETHGVIPVPRLSSVSWEIVVDRFLEMHLWASLDEHKSPYQTAAKYDFIFATDVKDVIFQVDPSLWIGKKIDWWDRSVFAGGEGLRYEDEPWGNDNLYNSFPLHYGQLRKYEILNAGSFCVRGDAFSAFVHAVFAASIAQLTTLHNCPYNPDQAALNVVLRSPGWREELHNFDHDDGYCCQAGTTADPNKIGSFRPKLLCKEPVLKDGIVYTSTGKPYMMVHQYDRNPIWKTALEGKFL